MAKYLRYSGEFLDIKSAVWRCEIWQEADTAFGTVGELSFAADALSIEWAEKSKEEVICGSAATLKIISPSDRAYIDLYSIEVGRVRLDVYKRGALYWSGIIDPEFYEEPYESAKGYTVSLTFSDFGILDRYSYDLTGEQSLSQIVEYALSRAGINYGGIDTSMVSTCFADDASTIAGGGLMVRSDNFIDEDGVQSTLYAAIEGILQPLALRIVQRAGKIYIYDLNGLYNAGEGKAIEWAGSSQTMGTDKVVNNVTVSFSPYSSANLASDELSYDAKYDVAHKNLSSDSVATEEYGDFYSYYPDYGDSSRQGTDWDYRLVDFTIFYSNKGHGLKSVGSNCKYFHILPVTGSATELSGVAYAFRTGGHGDISTGWPKWKIHSSVPHGKLTGGNEILTTERAYLPKLDTASAGKYRVRLVEQILLDARYNPFSGSTEGNQESNDNIVKTCSAFVFIPAKVTLYDADDNALYHYSNIDTAKSSAKGFIGYGGGKWVEGADLGGDCWLEYYKPDDLGEDAGIRGWCGNRHCFGRPDGRGGRNKEEIFNSFIKMDDGEYMPYPPVAGYLEVQIQTGVLGYDYGLAIDDCEFGSTSSQWDAMGIYKMLRWCLYRAPKVDVVNNNLVFDNAELEDAEYSGYINKAAKESLNIDTICGTASTICPTAKGIYNRASTGEQVQQLQRAGVTDHPEKLLIGTLYSQFAARKTTLAGDAEIDGGMHWYSEANQGDRRFMLLSDVQDIRMATSEAKYCEFVPDEYESIDEV